MSRWTPCKRREFIRRPQKLRFEGPYSGPRRQFMVYAQHRPAIPSNTEDSVPQLGMMEREMEEILDREIPADEWNGL